MPSARCWGAGAGDGCSSPCELAPVFIGYWARMYVHVSQEYTYKEVEKPANTGERWNRWGLLGSFRLTGPRSFMQSTASRKELTAMASLCLPGGHYIELISAKHKKSQDAVVMLAPAEQHRGAPGYKTELLLVEVPQQQKDGLEGHHTLCI